MPPEVAGFSTMRAGRPEWSPIPTSVVSRFSVVCIASPEPHVPAARRASVAMQYRDLADLRQINVYDAL